MSRYYWTNWLKNLSDNAINRYRAVVKIFEQLLTTFYFLSHSGCFEYRYPINNQWNFAWCKHQWRTTRWPALLLWRNLDTRRIIRMKKLLVRNVRHPVYPRRRPVASSDVREMGNGRYEQKVVHAINQVLRESERLQSVREKSEYSYPSWSLIAV